MWDTTRAGVVLVDAIHYKQYVLLLLGPPTLLFMGSNLNRTNVIRVPPRSAAILTCTEQDYPLVPPMGTNKRCLSKIAFQKGMQEGWGSEALRLCKFRASVPSGSPLFLTRPPSRSVY